MTRKLMEVNIKRQVILFGHIKGHHFYEIHTEGKDKSRQRKDSGTSGAITLREEQAEVCQSAARMRGRELEIYCS